jgi:hypothetical protein
MTKEQEALKLALEAIEELRYSSSTFKSDKLSAAAITAIKEALLQPDAFEQGRQEGMRQERALWTLTKVGQEIEQNFCPRCGKRTADIHTCTPPQENT